MVVGATPRRGFFVRGLAAALLVGGGGSAAEARGQEAVGKLPPGQPPPGPPHRRPRPASPARRRRRPPPKPLILVDPGHGGHDPGALGLRGTPEKTVVLAVARELRRALRATGRYRVALTREGDASVPLRTRLDSARRSGAALIVSLHADSAPGARGASVYTLSTAPPDPSVHRLPERQGAAGRRRMRTTAPPPLQPGRMAAPGAMAGRGTGAGSARLAKLAVAEVGRVAPLLPDPLREAGFAVLRASGIPSVLVELGFLSHPGDEALLRRAAHRKRLAGALARAVDGWFVGGDRPPLVADRLAVADGAG